MLVSLKLGADFSRGCALPMMAHTIRLTHSDPLPSQFANRYPQSQVAARGGNGAEYVIPAPFARLGYEVSAHKFVDVVIVTVLDARADASGPRGPETVADPALAEGGHACGRAVRGIA